MIDDPRAFKKGPARGGEASMSPAGQPVEQTLSRVILMGINSATKEPQPLNIDPDTGGIQVSNGVTSVTATAPLTSTGGTAPNIALTAGADKQILISNGTAYSSQTVSGDVTIGNTGVVAIGANKVTDAMLRQGVARSVVGVTGNATANVADIQGTADQVLRVNSAGTALAFGTVATAGIAANAVTDAVLRQGAARTVIGRSANSTGNVADISLAADGKFLGSRASAIGAFYPTQRLSKTTTYQLTQDDYGALVDCDTTSAGFTVTLPAPGTVGAGWWCTLRKTVAANLLTIARNASETINGASASHLLNAQYSYETLMCDGTNWAVVGVNDWLQYKQGLTGVPAATATWGNAGSVSLTPGEWDIAMNAVFTLNASTGTFVQICPSANSGATTTDHEAGYNQVGTLYPAAAYDVALSVAGWRQVLTTTTTIYAKVRATYTAGAPNVGLAMSCRRVG